MMTKEKGSSNYAWLIIIALSILFIICTLFIISRGSEVLTTGFKLAGSSQLTEDIETNALKFMEMSMLKPLWEELWIGIFGIFIALGLKKNTKYAWTLGTFWGIMMITNAVVQGGYEIFILGWSRVCLQTYLFLLLGVIALITLVFSRKEFLNGK
ncbi:MAG: hypothetical protein ACFFC7_28365 [Candidatus Hermodarchaeota archaeon]